MKGLSTTIAGILFLLVFLGSTAASMAASMELWPSDRRRNNTLYCYGNDWNMLKIGLYSDKNASSNSGGKYKIKLPKSFTEPAILEVTLPRAVEFLGASLSDMNHVSKEFETVDITENNRQYRQIRIVLDNNRLNERMKDAFYDIFVWYMPPEYLDDKVGWTFTYGGKQLASSSNRFRTAGVVREGQKLPHRFVFYPYGPSSIVPNEDFDKVSDFYKRFGIHGIVLSWSFGLPQSEERLRKMLEAHHRQGIKNIANMDTLCRKYGRGLDTAGSHNIKDDKGLVNAMDQACQGIESKEARREWKDASRYFDMALYDWEPEGPQTWPGYDDSACIAAFSQAQGLNDPISPELIKTKYRQAYARFRMEQTVRPLYSLRKTINAGKPMPLIIEQGDGSARNIDYAIYARGFDILRPMIYKPSPLAYARDVLEMLDGTSISGKKFMPDLTIGWPSGGSLRESPEEFLLDTMISAAAGLGGIGHWPEMYRTDAALFGIHEGLARIALVEDFYFDGQPVDTVSVRGLSYREKTIDLGSRKLTFHAPDWRPVLLSFVHRLKTDYLVTILNYHAEQDAFVEISSPELKNRFLIDPVDKVYVVCNDAGHAVVRIGSESPALWIATADAARAADCRRIDPAMIQSQLESAKKKYLQTNLEGEVQTGQVGSIQVEYDQINFNGDPSTCLRVNTPKQTVFFGENGGRIYEWRIPDMPILTALDGRRSDGVGMDLLWLPESGRWSGDEIAPMTLTTCHNDGRSTKVVYEGEFKKGYPGIKLRKAYTICASGTTLTVDVTLVNTLSGPAKLSYWQHSMFQASTFDLISGSKPPVQVASGQFVAPSRNMPDALVPHLPSGGTRGEPTGPVFAQYFPESRGGVIFHLPEEFMNVYFWSSPQRNVSTSEWMSQPLTIPAGQSRTLRYSITAIPRTSVEALCHQIK